MLGTRIGTLLALVSLSLVACGGGSSNRGGAATAAPSTSGTSPTTSNTAPTTSTTNPVPTPTLQTDALISSFTLEEVIEVDAKAGTITDRWSTGQGPADVINDRTTTYVANAISQDITVIDRLANNTVATIDVTSVSVSGLANIPLIGSLASTIDPILANLVRPTGLAITPNGNKLYSANLLNVTVIDTATMQPTKSILGLNSLSLTNLISNPSQALTNFISAPVRGLGMAKAAATDDHALVTCMISGTVMRIDARTDSVIDYTDVGTGPIGIAIAQGKAYVSCAISGEVWVVDVATGAVLNTISNVGLIPVDVCVTTDAAQDKIYVANAVSGDIAVIDVATDMVVDTLPAGLPIASIFSQLGLTIPSSAQGGFQGLLNNFLQGFTTGLSNPSSFGNLLFGGQSGGGLLSPGSLVNGLLTAFLGFAGINQQMLNGLNLPAFGLFSVAVAHDPTLVCSGNALMGQLVSTDTTSKNVNAMTGLTGLGPVDVTTIVPR